MEGFGLGVGILRDDDADDDDDVDERYDDDNISQLPQEGAPLVIR